MTPLAVSVLAAVTAQDAEASTFRRITFDELVAASIAVVQVKVIDTSAAWTTEPHAYIATTAHLEVTRSLAGGFEVGDELFVREAGGDVGNYTIQAIGFPKFEPGEELVVFLSQWQDETGDWRVAEYGQGIYEVYRGADGVERLVPALLQGDSPNRDEFAPETVVPPMTPVRDLARALTQL